ncbi:hypothetical protein V8F20_006413 [Naviculisporaceae sp. PSN 640]
MVNRGEHESSGDKPILTKLPSGEYVCPFPGCLVKDKHRKTIGRHLKSTHRVWATRNWEFMKTEFKMDMAYPCPYNCPEVFTRRDNALRHVSEGRCRAVNGADRVI